MDWQSSLQKIWIDYLVWIREYLYSLIRHREDLEFADPRITRTVSDFSNLLSSFYGEPFISQFQQLWMQHIQLLSELGATVHSEEDYRPLRDAYYANAVQIASLLAGINPHWDEATWAGLLQREFYLEEYLTWLLHSNKYEEYVSQYDELYNSTQQIMSYMITGLKEQFPASSQTS